MVTVYWMASNARLPAKISVRDWNAQAFSSRTDVLNLDPADAKPTIAASWIALHTRSKTESRAKRTSNRVTWSQVNQMTPRNPMYAHKAEGQSAWVLRQHGKMGLTMDVVDLMCGGEC